MAIMLEILEVTGIATIQDSGRRGFNKFGVPTSGVMDWYAYQNANSLLTNSTNSAVIELGLGEITLRALRNTVIAVGPCGILTTFKFGYIMNPLHLKLSLFGRKRDGIQTKIV